MISFELFLLLTQKIGVRRPARPKKPARSRKFRTSCIMQHQQTFLILLHTGCCRLITRKLDMAEWEPGQSQRSRFPHATKQ